MGDPAFKILGRTRAAGLVRFKIRYGPQRYQ